MVDRLDTYRAKRDFKQTSEPSGTRKARGKGRKYLIQKHDASHLHYDFRIEHEGVLKSWAVPRGPSVDPGDKRLAVRTEDHPLEYGKFEGKIPKGQYGGGTVMIWDEGTWEPLEDPDEGFKNGKLKFEVHGERVKGGFALIRLRSDTGRKQGKENWLLIKERDEYAKDNGGSFVESQLTSVLSGRKMDEIAESEEEWHSNKPIEENVKRLKATKRASAPRRGSARGRTTRSTSAKKATPKKKKKRKRELPEFVAPQLATLVDAPPAGGDWLHEIKFDGYRAIAALAGDQARVYTRNGHDWSGRFAQLIAPLKKLDCESALVDGEIVVMDAEGRTHFGALQDAIAEGKAGMRYYLFDLLELDGEDLRKRPLSERKKALKQLFENSETNGAILFSDHVKGGGQNVFDRACDLKLEGIISKRLDAPYRSGRTANWLKSKCGMEQEFVIIGWRPSDKVKRPFSSLLLAVREGKKLRYAGRVGSGYSDQGLDKLAALFKKHARATPPVDDVPRPVTRQARFVEPVLVAEISFRGWTDDGYVRQAAFKGLREDKPADAIVREKPMPKAKAEKKAEKLAKSSRAKKTAAPSIRSSKDEEMIEGVRVTHPDKILFEDTGTTKRDLIAHYVNVADRMLPHIAKRPISLVRCPDGTAGEHFFQKHASKGFPEEFKAVPIREKSGKKDYIYIEDLQGLVAAVQMSAIELHLWGAHEDDVEKPDRMVFDLDPDEGMSYARVKQAAKELRDRLKKLGLISFPMVTGGKGVHVVIPLVRGHSWDHHRDFAEAIARLMAEEEPDRFVANMSKAKRKGKIFVDYLRNTRGATAIAPYSARARKGAPFSAPLTWPALAKLDHAHPYTVGDKPRGDPWKDYFHVKQRLPAGK